MNRQRVYLASPLGFAASTQPFMATLVEQLSDHVDIENPWDDVRFVDEFAAIEQLDSYAERLERLGKVNHELGRANAERIDRSDAIIAILDGVDVDSGTASEIGYGFARGKHVDGLRTDFRLAGDNLGSIVNLQVQYFITASGGRVFQNVNDLILAWTEQAEQ